MKRKTRIERVYNGDTGWFEPREVELNSYSFTDDDRIMIVREYMESEALQEEQKQLDEIGGQLFFRNRS